MHFGKVRSGELYSVSPMATLGPTVREFSQFGVWSEQRLRESEKRVNEYESRRFERSRVDGSRDREFELDSGVIPAVKSETNKESEN
jgi:hypothetical protein